MLSLKLMMFNKEMTYIFWGLALALLVFGFWTKNYLALIYFPLGTMVGVLISKPRPGGRL